MNALRDPVTENKVGQATVASRQVGQAVEGIKLALAASFPARTNGFGIYADPALVQAVLCDAKTTLDAALACLQATQWPSAADYDEV